MKKDETDTREKEKYLFKKIWFIQKLRHEIKLLC